MPCSQTVELRRIDHAERSVLDRLVDDYLAELIVHREVPAGPTDAASYQYMPLYWEERGRHPFFLVTLRKAVPKALEQYGLGDPSKVPLNDAGSVYTHINHWCRTNLIGLHLPGAAESYMYS